MSDELYTKAELRALSRTRISAHVKKFVDEHGKEKCDAMFAALQEKDHRRLTRRKS